MTGQEKMAEKIALLGGNGMLGSDLAKALQKHNFHFEVFDIPGFDITKTSHLEQAVSSFSLIINCAAYTDVEKAESQPDLAYLVNAQAVGQLAALAKRAGRYVLHISTDFVFDGKSDKPYSETDATNPINIYGETKLAGENLLIASGCPHCIIRVQWTYGLAGNNFITKLIERAKKDANLKVVDDQTGSPTATTEVADVICQLVPKKPAGLFHFANAGCASRFDVAKFVFEKLKMPVVLTPCKTGEFPAAAKRPLNSCFDCTRIISLLERPIDHWQVPLERFLKQL
jgi:dTDP-4-dehydrorhamnose reductase